MTPADARPAGALVALEGIDGSGKSSVARALALRWRKRGLPVHRASEPRDRRLGAAALAIAGSDPFGAAMLFTLDRALVRPEMDRLLGIPGIVLQDRSYFSTLAYQGGRLPPSDRRSLAGLQTRVARPPERVLWLDLDPAVAVRRVAARGRPLAPVERAAFLREVRAAYASMDRPPRWVRIDAARPLDEVVDACDRALRPWLRNRFGPPPPGT